MPYQARTAASTALSLRALAQGGQNKLGHAPNTPAANESETMSHWKNDKLNRQLDAEIIIDTARKIHDEGVVTGKNGLVMAINAPWGGGKSYLLNGIAENLGRAGYKVLRFNAWENDYSKDALSSFLAEMGDQIESLFGTGNEKVADFKKSAKRIAWDVSKVFFAAALKKLSGAAIDDLVEAANGEIGEGASPEFTKDLFTQHKDLKEQVALLRKSLLDLYQSQESPPKPIFILVDELDRCRPNFSIELLEAIKHIFQVDGICFLVAVNKEELINSIKVIYGESFDSRHYLQRFFDVDYKVKVTVSAELWEVHLNRYGKLTEKLYLPGSDKITTYLNDLSHSFGLTPRDIEQVCFKLYLLNGRINTGNQQLHIGCLMPLLFAQQKNITVTLHSTDNRFATALRAKTYDSENAEFCADLGNGLHSIPTVMLFSYYCSSSQISNQKANGVALLNRIHQDEFSYTAYKEQVEMLGHVTMQI
ncbi:P-loop NTPase fold protein [Vogesella sp.]|uniref:KAP family P-loop NTPase fold protein n=1 Tax=Vogesella sp. TaxID=1904252 RepID=UPI00391B6069